jgi:predicted NBD/HSP70 family sugar kinase
VRVGRATPGSQTSLREANRARIVSAVTQRGSLTQVELAGVTGLSAATVSNIVKELASAGLLHTSPTSRSGRRAQEVTLARQVGLVAGVSFGLRSMRLQVVDVAHQLVAERRMPLPQDHRADSGLDRLALLVAELVESVGSSMDELLALGVGIAAPVDQREGQVLALGILRGWDGVNVAEVLGERLGIPVHLDNSGNLGALAELRYGNIRGHQHAAYLHLSHGVGAGLVLGGQVFHGAFGTAGEFGHVTIDESGPICRCGNRGCLETYVGAPALTALLRESHGHLTLGDVVAEAEKGDPGCSRVISDAGRYVGLAAADLCNLINPAVVVVGGELAAAGDLLLDPIREVLSRCSIPNQDGPVPVLQSALGADVEVRGAVALALDSVQIDTGDLGAHRG